MVGKSFCAFLTSCNTLRFLVILGCLIATTLPILKPDLLLFYPVAPVIFIGFKLAKYGYGTEMILTLATGFAVVGIVVNILLIIGALRKKRSLMLPWLILTIIILVADFVLRCNFLYESFQRRRSSSWLKQAKVGICVQVTWQTFFGLVLGLFKSYDKDWKEVFKIIRIPEKMEV